MDKKFILTYPNEPYDRQYYHYTFTDKPEGICYTPFREEAAVLTEEEANAILEEYGNCHKDFQKLEATNA